MVAIAVAVTAVTAGAAAPYTGSVIAGVLGGAAGSVAAQSFGVATGMQDAIDWKSVGISAITGGVNAGLAGSFATVGGSTIVGDVVRGATANALTQGVAVATGLQDRFSWADVAVAGVISGFDGRFGGRIARAAGGGHFGEAARGTASAAVGAGTRSLIEGSSFGDNLISALPQAICQTIGNMVAGGIQEAARAKPVEQASLLEQYPDSFELASLGGLAMYMQMGGGIAAGGQPTAQRGFWGRQLDNLASFGKRTFVDPVVNAFRPVVELTDRGATYVQTRYDDTVTELEEVVVTGTRDARRSTVDFFSNGYAAYIAPIRERVVETAQAFGGGIRDLYLSDPSISRTSLPTGYADAMGNCYPGTGPLPGNDYNPIAHPLTTAGMAVGVVAAPYAAIAVGPYVVPAVTLVGTAQIGLDDGPVPFVPAGLGMADDVGRLAKPTSEFIGPLIGKSGFRTSTELADAVGVRYSSYVDDAYGVALDSEARGLLRGNPNTRIGDAVDRDSARRLKGWLASEGITEGPNSMVQMNRWLRDPTGSSLYTRPDVRIPGAGAIYDATVGIKFNTTQINRFEQFSNGDRITIVRPQATNGNVVGSYSIVP